MDSSTPEQRRVIVDRIAHRDPALAALKCVPRIALSDNLAQIHGIPTRCRPQRNSLAAGRR